MKIKIIYIVCFGLFRHLWNYYQNTNHIYCVFRIILDTYGIIMQNENHINCVLRIILDTYGIIMKKKIIYIVIFLFFRYLWNYNKNKNHKYIFFFGLLETLIEL